MYKTKIKIQWKKKRVEVVVGRDVSFGRKTMYFLMSFLSQRN